MKSRSLSTRIRQHQVRHGRRRRYPQPLRREILSEVETRRAHGEGIGQIASSLGVSAWTIYGWLRDEPADLRPRFRRVEVASSPSQVVLVTPAGYRLAGDAESLAAVLKALS